MAVWKSVRDILNFKLLKECSRLKIVIIKISPWMHDVMLKKMYYPTQNREFGVSTTAFDRYIFMVKPRE